MKLKDTVLCTQKIHGAFKKGHVGHVTNIDDDVICIDNICIAASLVGKHFTKIGGFFIRPVDSKRYHIHTGDGKSLCGKWLMRNFEQPIHKEDYEIGLEDCKTCYNKFRKEMGL